MPSTITECSTGWFRVPGNITGGMSGGPIMRTGDDYVVGIVSKDGSNIFEQAAKCWRMNVDVISLIVNLRAQT